MNIRLTNRSLVIGLFFASAVIIAYIVFIAGRIVLPENPVMVLSAILVYMAGWLISGVRLKYLHRILDGETLPLRDYFKARILGGFLAYLTPSALGGEPARAYYLSLKTGRGFSRYLTLALLEAYYDVMIVNIIAVGLSIYKLPLTIPVLIVGLASISYWLIFYYILKNLISPDKLVYPLDKIVGYTAEKIQRRTSGYENFAKTFREITDKIKLFDKAFIVALTIIYQVFFGITIGLILISYTGEPVSSISIFIEDIVKSVIAYFYSNSLAALPTPGGSISAEYGLSIILPPEAVVLSRIITYYTPVIMGLYIIYKDRILQGILDKLQQK